MSISISRTQVVVSALIVGACAMMFGVASYAHAAVYNPDINPDEFSHEITHPLFSLPVGITRTYEGETEDGETEHIEISITGKTKYVMGVKTLVYRDKVWIDGELVEDTWDYLAQHEDGDVWYFGEDVNNYENGEIANHDGSWLGGVDGAEPGIWMLADPEVGDEYRQEYYEGEAEDMGTVLAVNETVTVPYGTFQHCLKTHDWTPLDESANEHKYYCPGVAAFVYEFKPDTGEKLELIDVEGGGSSSNNDDDEEEEEDDDSNGEDADEDGDEDADGDEHEHEEGESDDHGHDPQGVAIGQSVAQMETLINLLRQLIALLLAQQAL